LVNGNYIVGDQINFKTTEISVVLGQDGKDEDITSVITYTAESYK
jgi:hypothetical protein